MVVGSEKNIWYTRQECRSQQKAIKDVIMVAEGNNRRPTCRRYLMLSSSTRNVRPVSSKNMYDVGIEHVNREVKFEDTADVRSPHLCQSEARPIRTSTSI